MKSKKLTYRVFKNSDGDYAVANQLEERNLLKSSGWRPISAPLDKASAERIAASLHSTGKAKGA